MKYVKISELVEEISMGPFGSDIKVEYFVDKGVPVLNGSNVAGVKVVDGFENYVTEERAKSYKKAIARRGDIVITHRGTLGQIAYVPEDSAFEKYVISQSQFRVKLNDKKVNPIYFAYYFHTDEGQKRLLSFKNHVGVPALAQATTNFRLLDFPLRTLNEQNSVVNVLRSLDAKIALNNRINAELEAMAKALYDYWFVQFDFPNAKGKPYKSSGGKMVWNEELKREIPAGWEAGVLSDIAHITMGQSPSGDTYNESGDGVVFFQGCTDFGARSPSIRQFTTAPTRYAEKDDVLLSVRAPVGTLNIADAKCCIGRGLAALRSKTDSQTYLYSILTDLKVVFDRRNSDGTTFGSITKDDLFNLSILHVSHDLIKDYENIATPIFTKQGLIEFETRELTALRDWLLPMLMNGQVTVN